MTKKKQSIKIYIRTFKFDDGTKESVESANLKDMMGAKYRGQWARKEFKKKKIKESIDSVRWE